MTDRVRVAVDATRCVCSSTCVGMAPDVFRIEDGVARPVHDVMEVSEELLDAVASCPVEAILLSPDGGALGDG
jgi:ferredoxin